MPLSSTQRAAVTQFINITQADKKIAEKLLKTHNWNVSQAVDGFFSANPPRAHSEPTISALNKLFDKYREHPTETPDTISLDGTQAYLAELGVAIDSIGLLLISTLVASPTLGEIPRQGFVDGWADHRAGTIAQQRSVLSTLLARLRSPEERTSPDGLFRNVYKHTFKLACPPGSKSVPLEQAVEYWRVVFGAEGANWKGKSTDWLGLWIGFVESKWKKAVNRDQWEQTLLFMGKTLEDETLGFWSEESSWPAVVDEFVGFVKESRGRAADGEKMETD